MRIFDFSNSGRLHWLRTFILLLLTTIFCLWFNQKSIEIYWKQQYNQSSPLKHLQRYTWWRKSDEVRSAIGGCRQLNTDFSDFDLETALDEGKHNGPSTDANVALDEGKHDGSSINDIEDMEGTDTRKASEVASAEQAQWDEEVENQLAELRTMFSASVLPPESAINAAKETRKKALSLDKVTLDESDFVVFLGDSMMQSFAPRMQRWFKKNHNIDSINLGRHSTGLTKKDYYDWPAKAESNLKTYKNLKLVVVLLGANDPWAIEAKKLQPFNSENWKKTYSGRMLRIVSAAHEQNAQVIWIGLPYMRIPKYSKKIVKIDDLMKKTLKSRAIYVPIRSLVSGSKEVYRDSIKIDGKRRRVRQRDGIHMSDYGNISIMNAIKPYLDIQKKAVMEKVK